MIGIALLFRATGVFLCMAGTQLNKKERLFCVIAYLPKATVQAAVGSVPLSLGLPCGQLVLSVAVLSILVTSRFVLNPRFCDCFRSPFQSV